MILFLLVLVVVGVLLTVVPMDATIRNIVVAVVALLALFWLLSFFGVLDEHWSNWGTWRHR
jgi:hypothetical protein